MCYVAPHLMLWHLAWYTIPYLALVLFSVVRHLHLAFLLLVVVHHPSPCTTTACFGALLVPYVIIVVCCGSWSLALHYYFCGFSPFALCYCCLLWCVVPCIVLLLFVMVCRPSFYIIVYYCSSSSPYVASVFYYGMLSLTLPYCSLLWCIAFTLCCCCSLWFIIPHLALLVCHSMLFLGTHFIMLLFVVVCHSSPYITTNTFLLKWCTSHPFLPCASFGAWSMNLKVLCVVLKK